MSDIRRTISHSERDCFNNCRAQWWGRYVLSTSPTLSHPVRRLGALFEAAFAARLRAWCVSLGHTPWPAVRRDALGRSFLDLDVPCETSPEAAIERACKREQWPCSDKYGSTEDAADLALALVERTYEAMGFAGGRFKPVIIKGWACVQARLEGPLPVPPDSYAATYYPGGASGVLDLFVYDGERAWRPVLVDTKVRESLSSEPDLGCDPQLALYQHLCASNGVRVHQCEQWEILGKLPEEPPLNEDGKTLSRAAEYAATRETFLAAAARHKIDLGPPAPIPATAPKKEQAAYKAALNRHERYMEHLDKLDARRWWQATPGGGTDEEVASLVRDFAADADLMAALVCTKDSDWPVAKPITRNLRTFAGSSCTRCDLQSDCHRSHAAGQTLAEALSTRPAGPTAQTPLVIDDLDLP